MQSRNNHVILSFRTFLKAQRIRSKPFRPVTIDGRRRFISMRILVGTCFRPPDEIGLPSRPRRWNMSLGRSRRSIPGDDISLGGVDARMYRIPWRREYCVSKLGEPWDSISMLPDYCQ